MDENASQNELLTLSPLETEIQQTGIFEATKRLQELAAKVVDDESRNLVSQAGSDLATKLKQVQGKRKEIYVPVYERTEAMRLTFDTPIKAAEQTLKASASTLNQYDERKRREAARLREEAEAAARKAAEEAERQKREAEEKKRKAEAEAAARKAAEEAEERRREDARLAAIEAERKRKEEERAALAREEERKRKEEEDARIAHALEADRVGNAHKVDTILEVPKPVAETVAMPVLPTRESEAAKRAEEAAAAEQERQARERAAKEQEELRLKEEKAKAEAKAAADAAAAAAEEAKRKQVEATAAAAAKEPPKDENLAKATRWQWRIKDFGAFAKALAEGVIPPSYVNFNPEDPASFKSPAITKDVTDNKGMFFGPGIEVFPVTTGGFRANDTKAEAAS